MPRVRAPREDEPEDVGIRCRKCNCADHKVVRTTRLPGERVRRTRQCRHCGHEFHTTEKVR